MASFRSFSKFLLIQFSLYALFCVQSAEFRRSHPVNENSNQFRAAQEHSNFFDISLAQADQRNDLFLSDDDVAYIKDVLRMTDLKQTPLDGLIKERHSLPNIDQLLKTLSGYGPVLKKTLADSFKNEQQSFSSKNSSRYGKIQWGTFENSASNLDVSKTKANDEVNFEDCMRDYAAYIEPLTNRLYNQLIRPSLCVNLTKPQCDELHPLFPEPIMPDWGRYFLDAHGKIPEGLLEGKLHWVGGHDMCFDQKVLYNDSLGLEHQFNGLYCRLSITPYTIPINLLYGVCAPDTCSKEMVFHYIYNENEFLRYILDNVLHMNISKVYCGQDLDPGTDTGVQVAVGVILGLVVLILIGTLYDGFFRIRLIRKHIDKGLNGSLSSSSSISDVLDTKLTWRHRVDLFLVAFSFYSNIAKIFGSKEQPGDLRVLNGIRYLSFVWVVLGHTYLFGPLYQESFINSNLITALTTLPQEFLFQFVINYPFNIDSFLVISGVLVAWWWLRYFETVSNDGRMTLRLAIKISLRHIARRYWRLAPALMFTIMFYSCLYRYFIDGPLYPSDISDAENCRVNWWVDMLMLHNLVRKSKMCLAWMFYVPMVFQMHVAALVALVPLVIWPIVGYIVMGAAFAANIGYTAYLFDNLRSNDDIGGLFSEYLMTPWCRCGTYIIGMAVGIILYKTNRKIRINPVLNVIGWLVAIGTMFAIVFSTYDEFKEGGSRWSPSARTAYDTLSHPAWGVCIGWIILSCATGHGGVINIFLEWNTFRALSRLVYTAFLTSVIMILRFAYSNRSLLYIDKLHMAYVFLGHLIYLIAMGLIFGILWHFTVSIGLENMVTCDNMQKWFRSGRYPPELDTVFTEKKYNKSD